MFAVVLNSVLSRAGQSLSSQYYKDSQSKSVVLLDGGSTLAQKILFVPWELNIQSSDKIKAQKVNYLILFDINKVLFVILVIVRFSQMVY